MAAFNGFAAYIFCPVTPDRKNIVPLLDQPLLDERPDRPDQTLADKVESVERRLAGDS